MGALNAADNCEYHDYRYPDAEQPTISKELHSAGQEQWLCIMGDLALLGWQRIIGGSSKTAWTPPLNAPSGSCRSKPGRVCDQHIPPHCSSFFAILPEQICVLLACGGDLSEAACSHTGTSGQQGGVELPGSGFSLPIRPHLHSRGLCSPD